MVKVTENAQEKCREKHLVLLVWDFKYCSWNSGQITIQGHCSIDQRLSHFSVTTIEILCKIYLTALSLDVLAASIRHLTLF